jgi:eukaryotic-like serine/threonine-protein kinase
MNQMTAKDQLEGVDLPGGWKVIKKLEKNQTDTGGHFSSGYVVASAKGEEHFLKAIDFSSAMRDKDPAKALQRLTAAFNLERSLLETSKRLSHVVQMVTDGTVSVNGHNGQPETVQFLVMELADESLRNMAVVSQRLPMSLGFSALHNVALGLRQLHGQNVAHQDMKPSNALKFKDGQFKVCDLGRSSVRGTVAPHDNYDVAGDRGYAPPELLFGHVDPDFVVRRWGCDAYLLGSLATFLVCGLSMTALIVDELDQASRPNTWSGTYAAVLPQVRAAFGRAVDRIGREITDDAPYKSELISCVRQLCDPDPAVRGHPNTRAILADFGNVYDLERYLSIFDRLSTVARIYEKQQQIA